MSFDEEIYKERARLVEPSAAAYRVNRDLNKTKIVWEHKYNKLFMCVIFLMCTTYFLVGGGSGRRRVLSELLHLA